MNKTIFGYLGSLIIIILIGNNKIFAQSGEKGTGPNVINTAVPFLTIAPDARGGGMGDVGVSSSADATSLFWNPAKYAFIDHRFGFEASYVPWLRALVDDIGLLSVYGYYKINDKSTVAASLRYFSLGEVKFTVGPEPQDVLGDFNPNEFAFDATYSRKFTEKISGAVAGRYIYSNLTQGQGQEDSHAGWSVAADVAFYYRQPFDNVAYGSTLGVGINISNIGRKISYTNSVINESFIPTTLRFGPSYEVEIDRYNSFAFYMDISKLLVPTPPTYYADSVDANGNRVIEAGEDPNVSVFQGMIQSFYDAPGGFKEEMQELMWGFGAEYWYNKMFAVRAGYFYENKNKGNRQYLGLGVSVKYNILDLGFSYIVPTNGQVSPQDNTLRFSLTLNFD